MKKVKVNKLLLSKYYANRSTKAEKEAVEAWLKADDLNESLEMSKEEKSQIKESIWRAISLENNFKGENLRPWFRKGIQVAAAACFLFASFLGGRVSANTNAPVPAESRKFHEHLYVYGGNGTHGNLPGEYFKVGFDGILRLFNASQKPQTLMAGDSIFTLIPNSNYYLLGSTNRAELFFEGQRPLENYDQAYNKGDFSIVRLDR